MAACILYVYCNPRDALFHVARARTCVNECVMGFSRSNLWEGLHNNHCTLSYSLDKPRGWDCAFWRITDRDRSAYFSDRISDISVVERAELPFFVLAAIVKDDNNTDREIDLTKNIRMFAWKGNTIGGVPFWRWFLFTFADGVELEDVKLSVVSSDTFTQDVIDPSIVMLL